MLKSSLLSLLFLQTLSLFFPLLILEIVLQTIIGLCKSKIINYSYILKILIYLQHTNNKFM